jgi:hypothetical protein
MNSNSLGAGTTVFPYFPPQNPGTNPNRCVLLAPCVRACVRACVRSCTLAAPNHSHHAPASYRSQIRVGAVQANSSAGANAR